MALSNQLLVIGLIAVLLGGGIYLLGQQKQQTDSQYFKDDSGDEYLADEYDTQEELFPEIETDVLGFEKATTSADCDKSTGFLRGECYKNLALINEDESFCTSISDTGQQDLCMHALALKTKNPALCKKVQFYAADCYTGIAIAKLDATVCEQADFEKSACRQAAASGDFALCANLGQFRRFCNDAADTRDASHCENIVDTSKSCFFELAQATQNPQYCTKTETSLTSVCVFKIAKSAQKHEYCSLLPTQDERENCIAVIAYNTGNTALCNQAGTQAQSCIEDIAEG